MTSTQVMNSQVSPIMNLVNSTQSTQKSDVGDFKSYLDNSKASQNEPVSEPIKERQVVKETKEETLNSVSEDAQKVEKDVADTSKPQTREPADDEVETVREAVDEVVNVIKSELDITDEELETVLSNLGIIPLALLIPQNVIEVAVETTESEGTISLVTDAGLYEKVKDLTQVVEAAVEEITNQIDVDPQEFLKAVNDVSQKMPNAEGIDLTNEAEMNPMDFTKITNANEMVDASIETVMEEVEVSISEENSTSTEPVKNLIPTAVRNDRLVAEGKEQVGNEDNDSVTIDIDTTQKHNFTIHNNLMSSEENEANADTGSNSSKVMMDMSEGSEELAKTPVLNFTNALVEKVVEAFNKDNVTTPYTTQDVEMIMEQMTENIKVSITQETKEVNIRLHPESLGNVNVRIQTNGEGVMSAQFTAQNESVKAVIESQLFVLRQALEDKGITVEAVEVMVGSHEFERNLSDSEKRGNNEEPSKRRTIRRINLNDENEEISQTENSIEREMMEQNGNTIDYQA